MAMDAIDRLILEVSREVRDPAVLSALRAVPRDRFVPPSLRQHAWEDRALSIGHSQTISQPTIVAVMTEAAALSSTDRVLEIGTGSGYQAAVLSHLAHEIVSVEVVDALREGAAELLRDLGIDNVIVLAAGAELGAPERGPYDAILVTAAAPELAPPLIDQLAEGGRMVAPIGSRDAQELVVATKHGARLERRSLGGCRFVPLRGEYGFED
ncbi:MAG: protein-L-isoaspartate(D-aspartate) O-methyltransferase [Chloroflexi bacterium]|nr:protein-L-isoaspartate(D-aspartate) O-methyltransferase [Chloroflexota bacterium]MDA1147733.1 protein-L-isoaspartate(D-aspartate) O-methyltransferase [Chloroflexota bacterium]